MYYYLSIGTNLSPETNAVKIVQHLCLGYGRLLLYPFVRTPPIEIDSNNLFLNSVAVVKTESDHKALKKNLDKIETSLGRDKDDPLSSTKDRVADIDIIHASQQFDPASKLKNKTDYLQQVLNLKAAVDLKAYGLPTIDRPTTVNIDSRSGQIIISDKKL